MLHFYDILLLYHIVVAWGFRAFYVIVTHHLSSPEPSTGLIREAEMHQHIFPLFQQDNAIEMCVQEFI